MCTSVASWNGMKRWSEILMTRSKISRKYSSAPCSFARWQGHFTNCRRRSCGTHLCLDHKASIYRRSASGEFGHFDHSFVVVESQRATGNRRKSGSTPAQRCQVRHTIYTIPQCVSVAPKQRATPRTVFSGCDIVYCVKWFNDTLYNASRLISEHYVGRWLATLLQPNVFLP